MPIARLTLFYDLKYIVFKHFFLYNTLSSKIDPTYVLANGGGRGIVSTKKNVNKRK